jgi:hypothetical protein
MVTGQTKDREALLAFFDFPADQALGSVALDAPDPMAEVHLRSPPKGR